MRPLRGWLCLWSMLLLSVPPSAAGQPDEFAARRARVMAALDATSALVLRAPDERNRSHDTGYRYRTDSNILYLTGENRPGLTLVMAPRGFRAGDTTVTFALFVRAETGDGAPPLRMPSDGVVRAPDELHAVLEALLPSVRTLYAMPMAPAFVNDWMNKRPVFLERESKKELAKRHPGVTLKNPGSLLGGFRAIKDAPEVERIRRSIAATHEGLVNAMKTCRPGAREYELQAAIEHAMLRHGALAPAFSSIVGSGPNSNILHYEHNHRIMQAGEVVVMDVGAEIDGYAADITRTIPVSGKFTKEQRTVYETVLRAQHAVIAAIRPGVPWSELDRAARAVIDSAGFGRFWRHSVSHHLGLDVHDIGPMDTLRTGVVLTVEPGIYIPAGDTTVAAGFRGVGVRIEDDVLVTADGGEVLSHAVPKEVTAVERLMRRK